MSAEEEAQAIANAKLRLYQSVVKMRELGVPSPRPDLYMTMSQLRKMFATQCVLAQQNLPLERYIDLLDALEESLAKVPPMDVDKELGPPTVQVGASDEVSCIVCLEEVGLDEPVFALECNHRFHPQCLRAWVRKGGKGTCPMDRQPLTKRRDSTTQQERRDSTQ